MYVQLAMESKIEDLKMMFDESVTEWTKEAAKPKGSDKACGADSPEKQQPGLREPCVREEERRLEGNVPGGERADRGRRRGRPGVAERTVAEGLTMLLQTAGRFSIAKGTPLLEQYVFEHVRSVILQIDRLLP